MNYIYDITLNFNKELYEFYEWKEEDCPEFVLKIPIFKVDEETFYDLLKNEINISKDFLDKIKNKTEVYSPNSLKIIKYASVFATEEAAFAINFDDNGCNVFKSSLSIDEEEDILELTKLFKYKIIDYKVKKYNKINLEFSTREEKNTSIYLIEEINKIYRKEENDILKYIYYEIFNKKLQDINKIYFNLLHIIKEKNNNMFKIKDILDLTNKETVNKNS